MAFEIPQPLLDEISSGRGSLFLGAGASCEAQFPGANELSAYLASAAGSPHASALINQPLDAVAQYLYLEPGYGKQWVRQKVIDYFEKRHSTVARPPSAAHELMTRIRWRTIFTTNYDRLVEIAYDACRDCVQRLLPIYSPDPQISRHEGETVRLIKLSGSVDEAARNSSHELVLTFAEQQDARSRNRAFYDLLREEAINGPLIFIGFRFAHPGVSTVGTSPEFEQLRDLLREMGPAARWHYCVDPFDEALSQAQIPIKMLHANQVDVLNTTFGEFLNAVNRGLASPATPLSKRQAIVVPVGRSTLSLEAEEFEKDRRQFELLSAQLEGLGPVSVTESLNGQETWRSFLDGHFVARLCRDDFRSVVETAISSAPEILLLGAPPGWGKTFLLKDLAIELYRSRRPVIWLNPYGTLEIEGSGKKTVTLGAWDTVRIDHILSRIADVAAKNSISAVDTVPVIIADNCPERSTEILSLFKDLATNRQFVLIFAVRENEYDSLVEEHILLKRARKFRPDQLYDSKQEVRSLVDFCTKNRVAGVEDVAQSDIIAQRILDEEAESALILALQVIFDKNHRPFSEIVRDFWERLPNPFAQKLVLRVAALHRLGSAYSPRLYTLLRTFPPHEHAQVLEVYRQCLDEGILFERMEEDEICVYTLHSLVAEHIMKVSAIPVGNVDDELIGLTKVMTGNTRDLEIIRRILKRITDYDINLSSETKTEQLFRVAAESTSDDWVVCQQFAKFLLKRGQHELALAWTERALENNQDYAPLQHTKGNVLRRWGMELLSQGDYELAQRKFQEARKWFAFSRVRRDPDEYGYVTHLDMLLYLLERERDEMQRANLLAEGVLLYREGIRAIPEDRFKYLLEERFQRAFDLRGTSASELYVRIEKAIESGKASPFASAFLAQHLYELGSFDHAVDVLRKQRQSSENGVLAWVKEAELQAREGHFSEASKCVDSARRRQSFAESAEVLWSVLYWDLIISTVLEDFRAAREATNKLNESGFYSGLFPTQLPGGYIWKESAREIKAEGRTFKENAKIWSGRIEGMRAGDRYGQISVTNIVGETLLIGFQPRYFTRKDFRRGDRVEFVISILPSRLRADDPLSKPFVNTIDDIYVV